jgi:PAS domain S-box-containing protein
VFAKGRTNLGRAATQHRATSVDGTVADITARKLAEEAVRIGEERYRTLFTAMDEGFCVIEMIRGPTGRWSDYRFLEMNPAFEKHTGLSGVVGCTIREIAPEHEDFWYQTYGRVASSGEPMRFVHHASAIGNRWFDVFAFPLPDASHTRVAVLFKDISDRKQAEEALRIAERRKDEFIATLAHELRNPLAPIRTAIKIIGNEGATASEHATARAIVDRQIATMSRLLDDLLDVSRITAGRLELRRESVSLWAALTAAIEASQPWIDARGHHLALDMPKEPVRLQADPVRLGQIITNLLNNAAKFTAPGGRIDLVAEADEHEVRIEVRDTGIGLAADQTERVFEMFLQVGTDRQVSEPGLGIGLAMVRGLTELHGGRVTARSAGVGCGAVFVVSLPRGSEELPAAPALAGPAPASRRRVLIVDDNADNTLSLAMLLQLDGHEVRTANTAAEALEVVRGFEPDFALLDIGLPDLDGYELAERLRAMPFVHRPTLVAITGRGQSEDKPRAFEAGFTQHFTKPVDPDRISSLLQ